MEHKEIDSDFAKVKYEQNLESMRHVQRLEATEMGFVVTAYGVLVAGLLNVAGKDAALFSQHWEILAPVCGLGLVMAGVLTYHFRRRWSSFYKHRDRLNEALWLLGEHFGTKKDKAGYRVRILLVWALAIAVVLLCIFLWA